MAKARVSQVYQNEISIALQNTEEVQPLTLTGFRSGDVRSIFFWVEDTSDTLNKYNWVLPNDVQLSYNGTVIHNFKGTSSQIFDLMGSDVPSNFNNSKLAITAGAFTSTPIRTNWTNLPLSQIYEQLSASHLMVGGLKIENAVVNLQLRMPVKKSTYVAKFAYAYNSVLFVSGGTAEYIY